jgi:hypothetical protein
VVVQIERLVDAEAARLGDTPGVGLGVVLVRRRPHLDQLADGVEMLAVIMRDQQHRRGAQTHDRILELLEGAIAVEFRRHPALPAVLRIEPDVQRIVVADAAYSAEVGRRFRAKSATCSNRSGPGIPVKSAGVASSAD